MMNAASVYNFSDYHGKGKSPIKESKSGFDGNPRVIIDAQVLNPIQLLILSFICSGIGDRPFFKRGKAWFCRRANRSYSTVCRVLNQLEKFGIIETVGTGENFKIFLTEICYLSDVKQVQDAVNKALKTEQTFRNNEKKVINSENFTYISKKENKKNTPKPSLKLPPDQPPDPPNQNQPKAVFFQNKTKEKLGAFADEIAINCWIMMDRTNFDPKLNPVKLIKWALKEHFHPKAIAESIKYLLSQNDIKRLNIYKITNHICKKNTPIYNEDDHIKKSERYKTEPIEIIKMGQLFDEL